jgi:hypothetical protein
VRVICVQLERKKGPPVMLSGSFAL